MAPKKKTQKDPKPEKVEADVPVIPEKSEKSEKTRVGTQHDRIAKLFSQKIFRELSKDHGNMILTRASDARVAKSLRLPTGIFPLDKKLGGGLPQGRVITLYGMKSTGKTYIILRTLATTQRMCSNCWSFVEWSHLVEHDMEEVDEKTGEVTKVLDPKTGEVKKRAVWEPFWVKRWWQDNGGKYRVRLRGTMKPNPDEEAAKDFPTVPDVTLGEEIRPKCDCEKYREAVCGFIDVEGTFDKPWAERCDVDLLKLMLSQPEAAEHSLDIADALVRSGECDVLALDSVAFLTPSKEIAESTNKETMGVQARLVGKGVRKFVSGLNAVALYSERRPTILLTNQIRMKIGVMFGNPETVSGGLAPGFASSVEVKTKGAKFEFEKQEKGDDEADKIPLEVELNFDVEKNKTDVAKRSGHFRLVLVDGETKKKGDVADEEIVMEVAEEFGLIAKGGKGWTCFGEDYTAKSHIQRKLLINPLFSQRLRQATLQAVLATDRAWAEVEDLPAEPEAPEAAPEAT
jgi:protein RecA